MAERTDRTDDRTDERLERPAAARREGHLYVVDARNAHALAASLESYPRDKHYAVLYDASVWARFDTLIQGERVERLPVQKLISLQVFYAELLRILEAYENVVVLPEIKIELANLIAASHAQIDRLKVEYERLSPARKDRVAKVFSALLRLEELLRKLRTRLEARSRALPETQPAALEILVETVVAIAETLQLKKPEAVSSEVDERLVARAYHELLWNHRKVAIYTRDEDVRRVTSAVFKLLVSQTIRDEAVAFVVKALKLGNLVVLKYNADREEYARFFESQTHPEIGEYIFSKFLPERAKVRLVNLVRTNMARLGKLLAERVPTAAASTREEVDAEPRLLEALELIHDRMVWYQEVARAVGVADVHEEIRVTSALYEVVRGLGHEELGRLIRRTLEGLMRKRMALYLREVEAKEKALEEELASLTRDGAYQRHLRAAERLGTIAQEIAGTAREKHFFARALGTGDFHLTHDHFRRTSDLLERLRANGYDLSEGECLIPATDLADLTGLGYQAVLRLASEHQLGDESGLVKVDLTTLIRRFV